MRKRIFEIIEVSDGRDRLSSIYDAAMLFFITCSLIPLAFKAEPPFFIVIDKVCAGIFILDYIFRLCTSDYKYGNQSAASFIRYPFSFMAVIDLISILPSLSVLNNGFKLLRLMRMMRALRVFRVFKTFRYSKSVRIIANVFRRSREPLIAVCTLAGAYILISALIIFNVEPDSFNTFFDAIYWATVSLTTMGYGDIYPITTAGRVITMVSSIFGIAIVALPAGIITAGYMNEINETDSTEQKQMK